jgi:hypothetical protein
VDQVRILDFFLLFPFLVGEIRLRPRHRNLKKVAREYTSLIPYGGLPDPKFLFGRMEPIQQAAVETMTARGYFDAQAYERRMISDTGKIAPAEVMERVVRLNEKQADLMSFLFLLVSEYPLLGPDGLKSRTDLIEYRYDPV